MGMEGEAEKPKTESDDPVACAKTPPPRCPACEGEGAEVPHVTPRFTLKSPFRKSVLEQGHYHFCATPTCDVVYYACDGQHQFTTAQLINRVTVKDEDPKTPLCYCYRILKEHALRQLEKQGNSDVVALIKGRMQERPSQCLKFNPRGHCCTGDIEQWLQKQGVELAENPEGDDCCRSESDGSSR
uniref:CopZ zinc binding domain-containing protein n=1 Tax=Magnetococcus massalia (strain MO-1) TaxID=451514 RepID=A0A1S7LJZ3_MAGMO|nr:Protein of unknown function [Candidatus Magnetococcus massalia]